MNITVIRKAYTAVISDTSSEMLRGMLRGMVLQPGL